MNTICKSIIEIICKYLKTTDNDSFRSTSSYICKIINPIYFYEKKIKTSKINKKNKYLFRYFVNKYNLRINVFIYSIEQLAYFSNYNVEKIKFEHNFNKLHFEYFIPSSTREIIFGTRLNQPFTKKPFKNIKELELRYYKRPIKNLVLPSLEYLSIDYYGSFDLNYTKLPKSLKHLILHNKFNKPIQKLPPFLKELKLTFYNQPLEKNILPDTLEFLSLSCFDKPLGKNVLPSSLKKLYLNYFNQPLEINTLPCSLIKLAFGYFNQPIKKGVLPSSLTSLNFGHEFNQPIEENILPISLKKITIGMNNFLNIKKELFPPNLEKIRFKYNFKENINWEQIPSSLLYIDCCNFKIFNILFNAVNKNNNVVLKYIDYIKIE